MARLHILRQTAPNLYEVVVHAPTPVGNNAAGFAWSTAIANSGPPATVMPIGSGPGQISNSESNQVANGSVIEAPFAWQDDPTWTDQERLDDLELRAGIAVTNAIQEMQFRLRQFGRTVT